MIDNAFRTNPGCRTTPKGKPVTLIVGIVCQDSLVIACESQFTYGTRKEVDAIKTSRIDFKNNTIVVAEAGMVAESSRAVDFMRKMAGDVEITNDDSVMDVAERGVRKLRSNLLDGFGGHTSSEDSWRKYLMENHNFELMIGLMRGDRPSLFTINLYQAVAIRHPRYAFCGCGDGIADFIFKDLEIKDLSWKEANVMAIYAIEKAKDRDVACGGATRLTTMDENRIVAMPDGLMANVIGKVRKLAESSNEKLRNEIRTLIDGHFFKATLLPSKKGACGNGPAEAYQPHAPAI